MAWLQIHLEEFVKPRLGFIPQKINFFSPAELTVIKNTWRSAKIQAASRPMLLAGRDAFVFEILARREGFPTTFRPDISRATVNFVREDYHDYYLLDTGFVGSIAKGLSISHFGLASAANSDIMQAYGGGAIKNRQVFPRLRGARSLALKIESTPKYWTTAQYWKSELTGEIQIIQHYSAKEDFARAAGVTIQVYTNSAPKFIDKKSPLPVGRWQDYDV